MSQLAILLPSPPLMATPSQPRVMEPVVMTVLLLLLLQLPPSLMALSQAILPNLPTLAMASSLPPLHHRGMYLLTRNQISELHKNISIYLMLCPALSSPVTMLVVNQLVTTKTATPSQQHTASSNLATRPSRPAMASSRVDTSSRPSSSNRLLLLTLLRLLDHMGSLQLTSTASRVDRPVTSPTITVSFTFQVWYTSVFIC